MNTSKLIVLLAGIALSVPCSSATSKAKVVSALDEIAAQSGLTRVEKKGIDLVYRRSDASLSKYTKVKLHPVDVQFSKNFDPGKNSTLYRMNPPDLERIKTDLAEEFAKVFRKELQDKGGYQLVNEDGPDVLEVRAAIVNLYINAPDISRQVTGNVKVYTTEAGEMTLVMELRDSMTNTVLAQVYDRRAASGAGNWQWTTSVTNSADARQIIGVWASALRKAFDASRAS